MRRLIYDDQERPIQWLHGLYRPDRYEYVMQLSRVGSIDAKVWVSDDLSATDAIWSMTRPSGAVHERHCLP